MNSTYLVIQADDVGLTESINCATLELMEAGLVTSASVMAAAPSASSFLASITNRNLVGAHLQISTEFANGPCRPLSSRQEFPTRFRDIPTHEDFHELVAQLQWFKAHDIRITHCDSHLWKLFRDNWIEVFLTVALEFHIKPLLFFPDIDLIKAAKDSIHNFTLERIPELKERGYFVFDSLIRGYPKNNLKLQKEYIHHKLKILPPGRHILVLHPAEDDHEGRALSASWPRRVNELEIFRLNETKALLKNRDIQIIGMAQAMGGSD